MWLAGGVRPSSSAPMSVGRASGTDGKASLTSKAPISSIFRPDLASAFWVAGMGAVSMGMGAAPITTAVWMRAIGVSPWAAANSDVVISSAALPAQVGRAHA